MGAAGCVGGGSRDGSWQALIWVHLQTGARVVLIRIFSYSIGGRILEDSGIEQALRAIPHQRSFGRAELKGLAGQTPICHIRLDEQNSDVEGGLA